MYTSSLFHGGYTFSFPDEFFTGRYSFAVISGKVPLIANVDLLSTPSSKPVLIHDGQHRLLNIRKMSAMSTAVPHILHVPSSGRYSH